MFVTICDFLENSQHIFGTLTNSNELLRTHRNLLDLQEYDFRIRKCKVYLFWKWFFTCDDHSELM